MEPVIQNPGERNQFTYQYRSEFHPIPPDLSVLPFAIHADFHWKNNTQHKEKHSYQKWKWCNLSDSIFQFALKITHQTPHWTITDGLPDIRKSEKETQQEHMNICQSVFFFYSSMAVDGKTDWYSPNNRPGCPEYCILSTTSKNSRKTFDKKKNLKSLTLTYFQLKKKEIP